MCKQTTVVLVKDVREKTLEKIIKTKEAEKKESNPQTKESKSCQ